MPKLFVDEVRQLMDLKHNIRNLAVIAHVDHGKTTLTDSLVGAAGIIAEQRVGDMCYTQATKLEQVRGITIKATAVSMHFKLKYQEDLSEKEKKVSAEREVALKERRAKLEADAIARKAEEERENAEGQEEEETTEDATNEEKVEEKVEEKEEPVAVPVPADVPREKTAEEIRIEKLEIGQNDFLINLIDSPGHVDFSSEVTAALRCSDGALVVVDCVEGVCVQTETVLRQALAERIKPVLFLNKLDRVLCELRKDPEEAYQTFNKSIESVNVIIDTYHDPLLGDVQVAPTDGTVGFGAAVQAWAFSLSTFARMYADKFGMPKEKMMQKMWGDNFFDPKTNKWTSKSTDAAGKTLTRGFVQYIFKPIATMFETVLNNDDAKLNQLLDKLQIKLPEDAKELKEKKEYKKFLKRIMMTWLPAHEALLQMIVVHLPAPAVAQKYRVENLYNGPLTDRIADYIRNCDPKGPLMMFVSKMVPSSDPGRFYAFGRVFSGTVKCNQSVRIYGPDFKWGSKFDLYENKKVQRTMLMVGRSNEPISDCPCGNVIGLVGIDQYLLKAGTITDANDARPFHCMKFSVAPVVRVAVEVKNNSDLPKLVEGLRRLAKSDPLVQIITTNTGEHVIAGAGELHLDICMTDLQNEYMKNAPIKISEPVVAFNETIVSESELQCISKSANKHNRLYCVSDPLPHELCKMIEQGEVDPDSKDVKKRAKVFVDKFGWQKQDALKIWAFGCPPDGRANILVDATKAVAYLNEIKDAMASAFVQITSGGVFAEEPWRGIRVCLQDCVLHADSIHRGAGQIMPTAKRVYCACQIKSSPRMLEPMYFCDISVSIEKVSGVYATLQTRRGRVIPEADVETTGNQTHVKAYLPVLESFGFSQKLRQNTSGQAFPQMVFDHWEAIDSDIYDPNGKAQGIVLGIRQRKGLKAELPNFNDYYDKL